MTVAYVTFKSTGKRYKIEEASVTSGGWAVCSKGNESCAFLDMDCDTIKEGLNCHHPKPIFFIEEPKS